MAFFSRLRILDLCPVNVRLYLSILVRKVLEAELKSLIIARIDADASRMFALPDLELGAARVVKGARQSVAIRRKLYFHLFSVKVQENGIIVVLSSLKTLDLLEEPMIIWRLVNKRLDHCLREQRDGSECKQEALSHI